MPVIQMPRLSSTLLQAEAELWVRLLEHAAKTGDLEPLEYRLDQAHKQRFAQDVEKYLAAQGFGQNWLQQKLDQADAALAKREGWE